MEEKVTLSFDKLPEAKQWTIGKSYRVKLILRQIASDENGATFEVIDATSLEPADKGKRRFVSEGGYFQA